jgi:Glycosyltransferase family 87
MKLPVWLSAVLLVLAIARVGGVVFSAVSNTHGDYYASLPGAYVRTVNPTLWESPDMQGAMGYHRDTYYHGPVQYLILYPVAFLDSYEQIARALLAIYAVVIAAAIAFLIAALKRLAPRTSLAIPVVATTLLFFPLLQSYLQREFEVVILLGLAAALWLSIADRQQAAGAVLAGIAWFKYVPLLFAAYLALRAWVKALVVFLATSLAILLGAHLLFDLSLFFNNNVPAHAAQVMNVASYEFRPDAAGELVGFGFCTGWFASETTLANVRHGFCAVSARWPWFPPNLAYLALCGLVAIIYLMAHARFERDGKVSEERERWRRALEFSIVTTVCACFFFAHYYYLIILAVPLNVLLARYLSRTDYWRLAAWVLCYTLLSAFLVPTSLLSRLFGFDVWASYIKDGWFLYGELMLVALLLLEYSALSQGRAQEARRGDQEIKSTFV